MATGKKISSSKKPQKPSKLQIKKKKVRNLSAGEEAPAKMYFDFAGVILLALDAAGKIKEINKKGCELLGYSARGLIGKNWFTTCVPKRDRSGTSEVFKLLMKGKMKPAEYYENAVVDKKGKERIIAWHNKIISDKTGKIIGTISSGEDITDRKRAEEALKQSEQNLATTLNSIGDAVIATDVEERITRMNPVAESLTGWEISQALGKPLSEVFVIKNCATGRILKNPATQAIEKEKIVGLANHTILISKNGNEIHISDSAAPIKKPSGELLGVVLVFRDVTDRYEKNIHLQKSEESFRSIVQSSPMGIHIYDLTQDGRLVFAGANPAADKILGVNNSQFIGKTIEEAFPSLAKTEVPAKYKEAALKGKSWHTQQLTYKDNIIEGAFDVYAFQTSPGKMVALFLDVTQKKREEEKLKESEMRFKSMFDLAMDGMYVVDTENKKTFMVNDMMCKMLGYTCEEMFNMGVADIHPKKDLPYVIDQFERQARQEFTVAKDIPVLRKNGEVFYTDVSSSPLTFCGKKYVLGVFRDITDRIRMQEEMIKSHKLESVGVLAGGIAHDFNNIITALWGNLQLAGLYMNPAHKSFDLIRKSETACEKAANLTKQLLTFAKGGAPVKKVVSPIDLIRDTSEFSTSGSSVKLIFQIDESLWPVEIDEGQISQVIHNLIVNAIQSKPKDGLVNVSASNVQVKASNELATYIGEGKFVKISIADKGAGISKEHLSKIFDPYFTTKKTGSGLGLASCYSIIKNHNGYIRVESTAGKGSVFDVYLTASEKEVVIAKDINSGLQKGSGNILVMDDDELVIKTAGSALKELGYEVSFAGNGAEAIEALKKSIHEKKVFDLAILDLTIPGGMGGKDAIVAMKKILPGLKAIVSSGYSDDPVMANYEAYGFDGVLKKPYKIAELSAIIKNIISE